MPETEENYAKSAACAMAHNATLAAFKLWARTPQSAQLLRIVARTNPGILAKIIGRRARPNEFSISAAELVLIFGQKHRIN